MSENRRSIVLLSADALRADHLSSYGYHRETSPVLDDLAEESIRFEAEDGTVTPDQFLSAIQAFNTAVDVAPAGFLSQPPQEFIVVRAVLLALLEGATV